MNDVVLDIGGTSINIIVLTLEEEVILDFKYDAMPMPESQNFYKDINELKDWIIKLNAGKVRNLIISFPGMLKENKVFKWPNKSYWEGYSFEKLVEIFNPKKWHVLDDCTMGALSNFSLFESKDNSLYINVGTGIGCGLIINNQLYLGDNGNSGELGHITVEPNSLLTCSCGNNGCLQLFSSGKGILERAKGEDASLKKTTSLQGCLDNIVVKEKINKGANLLAHYVSNLINVLDITSIHINGGVTKIDEYNFILSKVIRERESNFLNRELDMVIRPYFNASLVGGIIKLLGKDKLDQVNLIINKIENNLKKVVNK